MKKISISLALLGFVVAYIAWHIAYRNESAVVNTVDNLAVENSQAEMLPFKWLRQSYVTKNGTESLLEEKEECFSLYELKALYSADKDVRNLEQFCDSTVENTADGYKISASCKNQSATFYVDVKLTTMHHKLHEWQQTIFDINHTMIQQERITFQQQGTCNVTN